MNVSKERERELAAEQAADWLVANLETQDAGQRAAFAEWLSKSPLHQEEYDEIKRLARDLHKAVANPAPSIEALVALARAEDGSNIRPIGARSRSSSRRHWIFVAAAAASLAIVSTSLWLGGSRQTAPTVPVAGDRYSTQHGQQLVQRLADGSLLHLNTDTSVAVRLQPKGRWVEIERGQVIFEVAHDPTRPFRVTAGSAEVVAVGTQFDVYLQGDSTLVTVVEGRVTVGATDGQANTAAVNARSPMQLAAGQQVRVVHGQLPSSPSEVDTHRTTAWLHRQIAFEHEPLAVVAAEFNRYAARPIDIETPALRALAVSGVFNVDDSESLIAFLRSLNGVGVEVTPTRIRVFKI
jgi:transmembrane sensor